MIDELCQLDQAIQDGRKIAKTSLCKEAAEGLKKLSERLNAIGYRISTERGDYNGNRT